VASFMLKHEHMLAVLVILALSLASTASSSGAAVAVDNLGMKWSAYGEILFEFRLTNSSSNVISFYGYGPSNPIYTTQTRFPGQWSDEPGLWCITGLSNQSLAANQSMTFSVPPPRDNPGWSLGWRIGVEARRD
jgi:hypothetical protein